MPAKGGSFWVFVCGYVILAAGLMNVGWDIAYRVKWATPTDMGIVVAEGVYFLLSATTLIIGECLRKLERRLDQIEAKRQ
jgi:hypothetical protein